MGFILIYITYPTIKEANKITSRLLQKRLIACANIFPVKSLYLWKGKIENSDEAVSIVKTKKGNWEKLKSEVKRIHPYKVPCIIKLDAEANKDYEDWLKSETR